LGGPGHSIRKLEGDVISFAIVFAAFAWTLSRIRVGVDVNSRLTIAINTAILLVLHFISNFRLNILFMSFGGEPTVSFLVTALVYASWATFERQQRLKELRAGKKWHTWHRGESRLLFLPCAANHVLRFIEPASVLLAGLVLRKLGCGGLGLWIAFCAVCAAIVESHAHATAVEHQFGTLNTLLEAEAGGATVDHFSASPNTSSRDARSASPLPTGADAELAAIIAKRKKEVI
jgi:hypothetical protein